jgi:hypothetical protein
MRKAEIQEFFRIMSFYESSMGAIYRCASTSLDGQKRNQKEDILILNKIILEFMSAIYLRNTLHGSLREILYKKTIFLLLNVP